MINKYSDRVVQFDSFDQDFVESVQQDFELPDGYEWIGASTSRRALRKVARVVGPALAYLYWKIALHVRIENRDVIRQAAHDAEKGGKGFFIFGNHTQPIGDVILSQLVAFPARPQVVCSPANLGIPVIGKLLPGLGALPIPDDRAGMKGFMSAVEAGINRGDCIVVYPEAHVWPYCSFIRPMPTTSFGFPIRTGSPSYCMTVTYQQRKRSKKPRATVYVDGPFMPNEDLPKAERKADLRDRICSCMEMRSAQSSYEYVEYRKRGERE